MGQQDTETRPSSKCLLNGRVGNKEKKYHACMARESSLEKYPALFCLLMFPHFLARHV